MHLTDKQTIFSKRQRAIVTLLLLVIIGFTVIYTLQDFVKRKAINDIHREGVSRSHFYATTLQDSLEKFRHLPYVLARDSKIISLLKGQTGSIRVNPHLEDFALATKALIFVLDQGGTTVACSNWRTEQSLLGYNFNYRPYFLDALKGESGGYYAMGIRTGNPGYFISYPVFDNGLFIGAIVVKVNLSSLQTSWSEGNETVLVSDSYGVLILSSNPQWRYSTLQPLSESTIKRIRFHRYPDQQLHHLPLTKNFSAQGNIITIEERDYLETPVQLPEYGWRLHYLSDIQRTNTLAKLTIIASFSFLFMLSLILLYYRQRSSLLASQRQAREAQAIKELNTRLFDEISDHKKTEESLRKTQKELLQAGKLAALGRMSAAVAHELNQPVTAIRTFLASCRIFIERGQIDSVEKNLSLISSLTDRMARITGQLKTFSSKTSLKQEPVDLVKRIDRVLEFTGPQLQHHDIKVTTHSVSQGKAIIMGDAVRIEQVFNNLLTNAMDALKECDPKVISITISCNHSTATVEFADNGHGIEPEIFEYLFEPFFTTKESGEGVGLGLSISYGIIQENGGTIQAENRTEGGARFTVKFPLLRQQ